MGQGQFFLDSNHAFLLLCRCDGESFCDIEVNSGVFGDPCPNTHKYVEVHYACSSHLGRLSGGPTTKKLPPWFLQGSAGSLWTSDANLESSLGAISPNEPILTDSNSGSPGRVPSKPMPRKPILVAQDAIQTTSSSSAIEDSSRRIPITTPKPRPSPSFVDEQAKTGESEKQTTTTIRVGTAGSNPDKNTDWTPSTPNESTTSSSQDTAAAEGKPIS